ncbi:MAG TPA: hypothetical protein VFG91_10620 [Woeseiaceae bacterium]|nr:hypothetical protein [Woeseiaceae bacterium]
MRDLNWQEAMLVAGGNGTVGEQAEDASLADPDSRSVTVTYQPPGSAVTLTAKCVEYRRGLDSEGSGSESGL